MEKTSESFEEKLKELEAIVSELESGDVSLEDMISMYEKGKKLYKDCNEMLSSFEKRINEVEKID